MLFLSFKLLQIKVPRYVLAPQPRGQVRSSQLDRKYQQISHENIVDIYSNPPHPPEAEEDTGQEIQKIDGEGRCVFVLLWAAITIAYLYI